jgi:serine/threonine protein kinase
MRKVLALKEINVGDKGGRHQLVTELRLLIQLEHQCIVPLIDAFYDDGHAFLALGYMDGGSLETLLEAYRAFAAREGFSSRGLPEEPSAHVLVQVLAGLAYLHGRDVVHRDLKPANVLLDTRGGVRVSDFGISKQLEATLGMAQSFVGTTSYMAPERLRGDDYSTASDVWGVGMVAYECALGEHPYQHAQSYYDLVLALSEGATPPRLSADAFPPPRREFVAAALCAQPAGRPRAAELLSHPWLAMHHRAVGSSAPAPHQLAAIAAAKLGAWSRTQPLADKSGRAVSLVANDVRKEAPACASGTKALGERFAACDLALPAAPSAAPVCSTWACAVCTFANASERAAACEMCGTPRKGTPAPCY